MMPAQHTHTPRAHTRKRIQTQPPQSTKRPFTNKSKILNEDDLRRSGRAAVEGPIITCKSSYLAISLHLVFSQQREHIWDHAKQAVQLVL